MEPLEGDDVDEDVDRLKSDFRVWRCDVSVAADFSGLAVVLSFCQGELVEN